MSTASHNKSNNMLLRSWLTDSSDSYLDLKPILHPARDALARIANTPINMYLSLTRKYIPCASGKVRGARTARYIIAWIRSDNKIYYRPSPDLRQTSVSPPILGDPLSDPRMCSSHRSRAICPSWSCRWKVRGCRCLFRYRTLRSICFMTRPRASLSLGSSISTRNSETY